MIDGIHSFHCHLMGLGGSSATGIDDARLVVKTVAPVESADIFYLAQPNNGTFEIVADKTTGAAVSTKAPSKTAMFARTAFPQPVQQITLQTHGRVRVFLFHLLRQRPYRCRRYGFVHDEFWLRKCVAGCNLIFPLFTGSKEWLHLR